MIRLATTDDFDFTYGLYMHLDVNPFLLYEKMDKVSFEPIFQDLKGNDLLYIYVASNEPTGMFKFIHMKYRNSHMAYLGGLAIHPSFFGKGYGFTMMQEIIELGTSKKLHRIELSTAVTNLKAITLYEKSGFEKEGTLRKYTYLKSENKFVDEVMMSYLY